MTSLNSKLVAGVIGLIAILIIVIIGLAVHSANAKANQELSDLKKANAGYVISINQLTSDKKQALALANATQIKYAADTLKLLALQYSFDSLGNQIKQSKILIHAKVTAIGKLNDTATVNLFRTNLNRLSQSIGN